MSLEQTAQDIFLELRYIEMKTDTAHCSLLIGLIMGGL